MMILNDDEQEEYTCLNVFNKMSLPSPSPLKTLPYHNNHNIINPSFESNETTTNITTEMMNDLNIYDEDALFLQSLFQMFFSLTNKLFRHFLMHHQHLMAPIVCAMSGGLIGGGIPYLILSYNNNNCSISHSWNHWNDQYRRRQRENQSFSLWRGVCVVSGVLLGFMMANMLCRMCVGFQTWKRACRLFMLDFRNIP